ncbi:glycosyltransferase family 4 protein [Natronoflexus pectinivorans]|uniref:Glycosyl transferase family 1 n=1 Tax=Natronoflexus pectinivorans TaxID=682526 RepID=A0A4R2GFP8_9BACT|nr:glycosyltransferase [Natronoflexus pectinivorans]TCO06863.1 glycosyl transferase family 1 [Natronoflexus pectinivorans]
MKKKSVKTLFVGPFSPPFTGDGVKNSCLKEGFESLGAKDFIWFDSICRKGNRFLHLLQLIPLMCKSRQIILSLNREGRFFTIWLFFLIRIFFQKKAALYVVGGTFDLQLMDMPVFNRRLYINAINKLDGIFAESAALKKGLENLGIKNVEIVYNPRKDSGDKWQLTNENSGKVLFISRVTEVKGVTVLMDAFESLAGDDSDLTLDIYGPVDEGYHDYFVKRVNASKGKIKYCGMIDPLEVQSVLVNYHFLALPTFHFGEGLPGILVEAGMAGTPIVITRFNALPEYFEDEKSALFVEPQDVSDLQNAMGKLLKNPDLSETLSDGIQKVAEPFRVEMVIEQSLDLFRGYGWNIITEGDGY